MNREENDRQIQLDSLIGELAEEFTQRVRRGELPDVEEYARRFPHAADVIRQVLTALALLGDSAASGAPSLETFKPHPQPGRLGDYHIIREIGRGGMGIVYEAEQQSLGRPVALKVLPRQALLDTKHKKRFLREAKAAARLHHTNIVPVFAVGEEAGLCYYAMQFIEGRNLDEVLVELKRLQAGRASNSVPPLAPPGDGARAAQAEPVSQQDALTVSDVNVSAADMAQSLVSGRFRATMSLAADSGSDDGPPDAVAELSPRSAVHETAAARLSETRPQAGVDLLSGLPGTTTGAAARGMYWQSVARVGLQAAEALDHAHRQGVLHRDVKPANLLLDAVGTVWVTDFGLAKADDQPNLTRTGDIVGTLRYMAPEAFQGKADALSDVYSLGLTLYELLALQPAFDGADRRQLMRQVMHEVPPRLRWLNPQIPRDLETVVHKAIERDPAGRYQSAGELAADLERYLNDEPIRARRTSPFVRLARWCRRNPAVASSTTVAALLLVVTVTTLAISNVRITHERNQKDEALAQAQRQERQAHKSAEQARRLQALAQIEAKRAKAEFLGTLYRRDEALQLYEEAEEISRSIRGEAHPETLFYADNIANSLHQLGRTAEAVERRIRVIDARRRALGYAHPSTLHSMYWLPEVIKDLSWAPDDSGTRAVELTQRLTERWPQSGAAWIALGVARHQAGDWSGAIEAFTRSTELRNAGTSFEWFYLSMAHSRLGDLATARRFFDQAAQWMDANRLRIAHLRELRLRALQELASALQSRSAPIEEIEAAFDDLARYYAREIELSEDTPSWSSRRKRLCRELARSDDLFSRVLQRIPQEPTLWIGRAQDRVLRSQWDEAAADYAKVANSRPLHMDSVEYACVLLLLGDEDAYQQLCRRLIDRFAPPEDNYAAFLLARCCTAGAAEGVDPLLVLEWARHGAEGGQPWLLHTLGMARYRAGHFDQAIRHFQEANTPNWPKQQVLNWLGMAMSYVGAGDIKEARRCVEEARRLAKITAAASSDEPLRVPPPDWICMHVMWREAEKLLKPHD